MFAYYTESGELVAVVRNVVSAQLPINLLANLKKNYDGFWITDLFEVSSGSDSSYYVTLESADNVIVLKSSGLTKWEVFQKEKKIVINISQVGFVGKSKPPVTPGVFILPPDNIVNQSLLKK